MSELTPLSASRIKTAQTCSWIYWCKYKLRMPDRSNEGASRGSVCHLVFECLGNPRHHKHYKAILKKNTLWASKPVGRMVMQYAKKLEVDDDDNLKLMDKMIVNGLRYDFFGEKLGKPTHALSEEEFNIIIDEGDKKYSIRGFIDKLFLYSRKKRAIIRDFKSSKQVFKGKDLTDNLQNLMYALAVKHLYPKYLKRHSEFVFIKFDLDEDLFGHPGSGLVRMDEISEDELEGFEHYLTEVQEFINSFSEGDGRSNLAATQGYPSDGSFGGPLACGKDGCKMHKGKPLLDEEGKKIPAYICAYRKPSTYYVLLNKEGKVKKSVFEEEKHELHANKTKGEVVEERNYEGCPHWNRRDPFEL
jgi:hypothetical protein